MKLNEWSIWGCGVLLLILLGCESTSQPDYTKLGLVQISGTVTMDGRPLAGAAVYFHDRPNRVYSYGTTDEVGHYSLMFDSRTAGVLPGEKEIEITTAKNPAAGERDSVAESDESSDEEQKNKATERKGAPGELVPAKYNTQTMLKFTVTESNSSVDFSLESR
ncbi:MAG: carboxypeptidase regulatory-like domain-containing protein [Planctomycetaceae bacterium]|nr:carboxypeptidase regulatory-like domain-containing protein [Planctomycetaceae bacterium]